MAGANYAACKYSVTMKISSEAVLSMLRGLAQHNESGSHPQISWGGTKAKDWVVAGRQATFRFTRSGDRAAFLDGASDLLVSGTWSVVRTDDDDPATPRRAS
ncbi:hypothetical protein DFJ75_3071 [Williamsia muralis]|uniref:Uncharacterized protein n=1 Tax=Williamsia marianensis TaxID=85044 RepID=A0A495K4W5_WILMA|nr:hypothetical protein DFJ75_3071 [Williamsia muralis]